jgi:acyl-coenzyme A synthetase/AMP-(fatty) acid ligase
MRAMGLRPGDGVAMEASPAYMAGFTHLITVALLGGPIGLLDPRDHRLALVMLADPAFRCWRGTAHFVDALTRCVLTGPPIVPPLCVVSTPVAEGLFDAFHDRFGVVLRQTYSTTETGTITFDDSPADRVQRDTVGCPLGLLEVRIGDHPSQPAGPDRDGRIWVRTPALMAGYGFPPDLERREEVDGWWPTQDLGRLRADGYLVLSGRRDDAIRTRENRTVNLAHVAACLRDIDGVADAAVVPMDTAAGRSFGAVVEGGPGLTDGEIRARLAGTLPPWAQPRALALVAALPRLPNGKPDRLACATMLTATASS